MFFLLFLLACLVAGHFLSRRKTGNMPPGPPKRPIIGNLLDMPNNYDWIEFARWSDMYGHLVSVSVFGTHVVIINNYTKAMEMLEKKSSIFSCRPYLPMISDLMGWGRTLGLLPYGPRFRQTRKLFHQELGSNSAVRSFFPQEESQARNFLRLCIGQPDQLLDHCFQHAAAIILRVAYGYKAKDTEDEIVRAANDAMETLSKAIAPGAFLVNQIPILRFVPEWFPGAGFKKTARIWAPLYDAMIDVPFNFAVEQLTAGTAEDSFTSKWLLRNLSGEDKDILKHGAGAMFGAGGETTAIALYTFFLQMCLNPDVQKRGQAEVDRIVGRERLPTCEDRENMPYIEALAQEILRWHIVVPTGLPHSTTQDDVHDGFFIPKGSIVLANIWKMSRDPHVYKNPEVFNPDRFLGPEPEQDPRDYVYGFGRRVCPGRHLANTTLFITLAMCLSVFDIAPIEEDGQVILPQYKPKSGTVSHLEEFKCRITPRIDEEKLAHLLQE